MTLKKSLKKNATVVAFSITILFLIGTIFSTSSFPTVEKPAEEIKTDKLVKKKVVVVPVLLERQERPVLSANSVYVLDLDSQTSLYEKDPQLPALPASTAKIITALVTMDYFPLDFEIEVGQISVEGQKMGLLLGERITVDSLIKGLLVFSANDAAVVLANNFPGGRDLFVSKMNLKAEEIGLSDSFFVNPAGLDGENQFTTAKDLVKASEYAIQNPYIAEVVAQEEVKVTSVDGKYIHKLKNINELVGKVDGVLGVKTGWTENAHENLVTYVNRNGKKIMIALLGSEDRFGETEKLINWIYNNYSWEVLEVVQ
jgi:D-alanyl-D-alanine carboxypeptidase